MPNISNANAIILGISPDSPDKLKKWKAKKDLPYDLLSDPDHEVLEAWGAWGEKRIFGAKVTGVIRSHWIIDEKGVIIDVQSPVSPKNSVKKAIETLG